MQWLTPWTVVGAVLCVLALVVLFYPFIFKIDFEAGLKGIEARLYIFKKTLYKYEKKFSDDENAVAEDSVGNDELANRPDNEEEVVPTYVPPKKKTEPVAEPTAGSVSRVSEPVKEKLESPKAEPVSTSEPSKTPVIKSDGPLPEKEESQESKANFIEKEAQASVPAEESKTGTAEKAKATKKKERRSLTDKEFWTILLTPDFDRIAFGAVKKWTVCLLKLFRVKFKDCFVEGIRSDVLTMGYGAAINGILKGFPYVGAWDFRMDWTGDHELHAAGRVDASVNLCRVIGILVATVFYGGVIAFQFWRRRSHVLKTNELPTLGWLRTKIVKQMAED